MTKKSILKFSLIGAVIALTIGGTVAYFKDTETSTGNKFVAGKFNLQIDNTCHYNGKVCTNGKWDGTDETCSCTWAKKDLAGELFFNLPDVKPGDYGEDTVSLHISNNDAWMCAEIANLVSDDNGCEKPESDVDETCGPNQGELKENLLFTVWKDTDCDNILDPAIPPVAEVPGYCSGQIYSLCMDFLDPFMCEQEGQPWNCYWDYDQWQCIGAQTNCDIFTTEEECYGPEPGCIWAPGTPGTPGLPAEQVLVTDKPAQSGYWAIADSTTGTGVLTGGKDYCLGVSWKVPLATSNIIQSDSLVGDVIFNAVQSRHMDTFKCSDLYPTPTPTPPPQCQTNSDCNDGNECTQDICDPTNQCQNPAVPDDTSCNDGFGICQAGICQHQPGEEICNGVDDNGDGQVDEGFPDTDGDSMADCIDTDDDNDGAIDAIDVAPLNPQICTDIDGDSCDDCSQNPTSSSSPTTPPWPAYTPSMGNDGPDSDGDGMCDLGDPTPEGNSPLVINEIDYDQPGTDDAEFIELKNITDHSINLSSYRLLLINGSEFPPSAYQTIDLPDVNLAASDYFVVCGTSVTDPNCDLNILSQIQNGSPDAVALYSGSALIDTVSYEGDTSGYTEGMGVIAPGDDGDTFDSGLSRYPDGQDTNNNNFDFVLSCSTPGQINTDNPSCLAP